MYLRDDRAPLFSTLPWLLYAELACDRQRCEQRNAMFIDVSIVKRRKNIEHDRVMHNERREMSWSDKDTL